MKSNLLVRLLPAALAAALAFGSAALAQQSLPDVSAIRPWSGRVILDDPEWQKRFLGSYGVLSGLEPEIKETEREVLREVLDLMGENPEAAAARLQSQMTADSSASLDFILANLLFQNGQEEEASRTYRSALEKFPDFRRAHKNLALLLVQEGKFREAVEHLSRAVELGDREGRNYGLMGYAYLNLEDYLAAEAAYRNAVLQQPGTRDWKLGLARSLLALQKYREAVGILETLIEENPEDSTLWLLQANAYIGSDQPKAAAANLEAVRLLGKSQPSMLVLLGDIYMNEGVPELAKEAYLEVIRADEKGERFQTAQRAAQLMVRTGSWGEAQEILKTIDRQYAGSLEDEQELEVLELKARVAQAQGRNEEAAGLLETIVRRDGTRGEALLALARHHREQGDTQKAIFLLERAQKLGDFEYQALLDHAQITVAERDYRKAAELLRSALQLKNEPRVERFLARVEQAIPPR